MSVPFGQFAFSRGEIAPALFGHVDLAGFHVAASTMRNMFVGFTGGAYSRPGTSFVGFSKQTGRGYPPRLVPFQFSILQGLALEFGNEYMRVISNGAFVTEAPIAITGATKANPCVLSITADGATAATPVANSTTSPYAPGDTITLAGGTYGTPAVLAVTNTLLQSVDVNAAGITYVPGDTIVPAGGTQSTPAQLTVATTQVVSATINAGGSSGTDGTQTVTGTTGTGTKFQASVTVSGGAITAILAITVPGAYTANPSNLGAEPVSGGTLTGASLAVVMGCRTVSVSAAGVFTANPSDRAFTQASTSGLGTDATFDFAVMAPHAVTVSAAGNYSVEPSNPVGQSATSGEGDGATFNVTWGAAAAFGAGDWIAVAGVGGMTELNGNTYVVGSASSSGVSLTDVYGNNINSTAFGAYTSGGTAARIYTLTTPYSEIDLPYLKWTQSADVMSICCRNQQTGTEYEPMELSRYADDNFVLAPLAIGASAAAPTGASAVSSGGSGTTHYQYVITSIDPANGTESVASNIAELDNVIDIAATAGSNQVSWNQVVGANNYNVYKAAESQLPIPIGSAFGYAATVAGTSWNDTNIVPDFQQVPPLDTNPFARGAILGVPVIAGGGGYTSSCTATITTSTGSGALLATVTSNGVLVDVIVLAAGKNYAPTDYVTITGNGAGAEAALTVGPSSGTYPSVVAYYQQRRVYASSGNNPDTYWMSQPGNFLDFDVRVPTIASDAITGNPWSVQVNGIQWMLPMPGGLLVFTGEQLWQLTGAGGSGLSPVAITPSDQQAQPQAFNGISATVPPTQIGYDVLFTDAVGSNVYDVTYQYWLNIYTGTDITIFSTHLFKGFSVEQWAWCRQPYKIVWAVRSDGAALSLTFLKEQEVIGWARHDTQGLFESVCSVIEPPVNAPYFAAQRFLAAGTAYTIERMDNRQWAAIEDSWCVDAAVSLPHTYPQATLYASSATGLGAISGVTDLVGGSNYSAATTAQVIDQNGEGPGGGATPELTIVDGVVTAVAFGAQGAGYIYPALVFNDPSGMGNGASGTCVLDNSATFSATAGVFSVGNVGNVIRTGGGVATITAYTDAEHVTANITQPIVQTIPNTGGAPIPQTAGNWTMDAPVTMVSGLGHLAGMSVTGLADGAVIPPTTVSTTGSISLGTAATQVIVGLGFEAQLQQPYMPEQTVQGQRKRIARVTARVEASGQFLIGANQPDASTLSPPRLVAAWNNMAVANPGQMTPPLLPPYGGTTLPLYTGDIRIPVKGGFAKPGQAAVQQSLPLPLNVLAFVPEYDLGDLVEGGKPAARSPQEQRRSGQQGPAGPLMPPFASGQYGVR
jgi:hypothetical protein